MKVAFGMKAHSGWAALVVLGTRSGELQVVDRCRMELVEKDEASWAKQPYHAAERLNAGDARDLVRRGIASYFLINHVLARRYSAIAILNWKRPSLLIGNLMVSLLSSEKCPQ